MIVTVPVVWFASTMMSSPVLIAWVAKWVPTMHGMANSLDMTAAWDVIPPSSVTMADAFRARTIMLGWVMDVTSTLPCLKSAASRINSSIPAFCTTNAFA